MTKETFPIIRYRTRELTSINYEKCEYGRTHARIQKIVGRSDDMHIIRGVRLVEHQSIKRSEGKAKRIIDNRDIGGNINGKTDISIFRE